VLDEPFTGLDALVRDELISGLLVCAENTTIFISSHDLADIESFASHIEFLDGGRLQFSDELESLSNRFREIVLTFEEIPPAAEHWPENWLLPGISGGVIRFIDPRFDLERTPTQLRSAFPGIREIEMSAMPLRSIFVTLAQSYKTKQQHPGP
jgi:ABC-2 type transport system ATP-binding protein